MIEIIFKRPLAIYNCSEPLNSGLSFKSGAFPFSSASLIELIQLWPETVATHRKVFAPFLFIAFDRKMILFFRFFLKLRSFLSYLTIRLRARVFYEQIVNEAQPSWLSLVENEGE